MPPHREGPQWSPACIPARATLTEESDEGHLFFESTPELLRVALVGAPAYFALLVMLRISGNRTLAKLNAFDLVITVSFGSVLAAAFLQQDVTLVQIVAAMAALVILQYAVAWSAVRWEAAGRLIKHDPQLVFHRGQFLRDAMRSARVTEHDILQGLRSRGVESFESLFAVILEPDGSLSVVQDDAASDGTLRDVI